MNKFYKSSLQASAILFSSTLLFSCDINAQKDRALSNDPGLEYAPQMYNSIPYESLKQEEANKFNPGGMNMRVPARHTIARGKLNYITYTADSANQDVMGVALINPLNPSTANIEDGKVLYTRFCSHCHGEGGAGDGLVAPKFKGVANLTSDAIKAKPMGHIFQVITRGKGRMMPHASQVNPEERWKIALYVKNVIQGAGTPENASGTEAKGGDATTAPAADATKPVQK